MTTPLFIALARCATARAHLAGAEPGSAARAQYWREISTAAVLSGAPSWPAADRLGALVP